MEYISTFPRHVLTKASRLAEYRLLDQNQGAGKLTFSNWCFFVDDGRDTLAISAESTDLPGNQIIVARGDPLVAGALTALQPFALLAGSDLTHLMFTDEVGSPQHYDGVADHWHIYAHGYHWVAASMTAQGQGTGVYLMQFRMETGVPVVHAQGVIFSPGVEDHYGNRLKNPTNDLFLVETPNGVAVGIRQNTELPTAGGTDETDKGHLILDVYVSGRTWTVTKHRLVGGSPSQAAWAMYSKSGGPFSSTPRESGKAWSHENGASCSAAESYVGSLIAPTRRYRLLAPDAITVHTASDINLIVLNEDFEPLSTQALVESDGSKSYSMPDEAVIPGAAIPAHLRTLPMTAGESRAMVWKRVHTETAAMNSPWPFDDYGELSMRVYGRGGGYTENHITPVGWKANRPHITVWKDYLVVAWDGGPWALEYNADGSVMEDPDRPGKYKVNWPRQCYATIYRLTR